MRYFKIPVHLLFFPVDESQPYAVSQLFVRPDTEL